jgi:arylsulfatase A-like enzyme
MIVRFLWLVIWALSCVSVYSETKKMPNVLFIAVDDLNHWLGYLGRNPQSKTPNIDKLAARGISFTRSYCAAPSCNPSRAALMSGMRPSSTGVYVNSNNWMQVIEQDKTLLTAFRNAGYYVCGSGKIYHDLYKRNEEWDDYYNSTPSQDPVPAEGDKVGVADILFGAIDAADSDLADWSIVDYGIEQLNKPQEKPFFLAVGLRKPHLPFFVPRKYFDMHPLEQIQLPPSKDGDLEDVPAWGKRLAAGKECHAKMLESGRWKEAVQAYLAACSYTDMNIGRLMDAYDKSPHRDNTIIVFWCDHGWHLGEKEHWRKFALWEEAVRSPLIWVVPGMTKPNQVCERTVDFMSIYPTLCDLCGINIPTHVEGKTIKSLLQDPQSPWATPAVSTHLFGNHTVRSEGWRYIRYVDGGEELYDESADPYEWKNLATDPQYSAKKAELAAFLPKKNVPDIGTERGKQDKPKMKGKKKAKR